MNEIPDVVAYLADKGIKTYPAAGAEVTTHCFFCPDGGGRSKKGKLYINTAEQMYHCKRCDAAGGSTLLLRHFGDYDDSKPASSGGDPAERRRILGEVTEFGQKVLTGHDDQMLYLLNERGLSPDTILDRRLGFIKPPWSLVDNVNARPQDLENTGLVYRDGPRKGQDFFYHHLLIPYISRGQVVQLRGKAPGGKYFTGPGEAVRLFNTDALDEAEDVIVTEGEFDCMVLAQELSLSPDDSVRRIGVVGMAGTGAFPTGFDSYFRDARRVFIGFDPDDPGRKAAVKAKEALGTRARIIELPTDLPKCDWTEFIAKRGHTWRDVIGLMGEASGKRLFSMREAGRRYRQQRNNVTGLQTGYAQLDATIMPGILPGQVMVLLAKTGTGKTIWLCNVANNLRDVPTLFISLEMTQEEVYERLRRIYLFEHPRASDDELESALGNLLICDMNRLGERDLSTLVEEYEVETGQRPELVIVDYLGYYARGMPGRSPYEKVSNAVMQLKAEAKHNRVAIIAPHQVNRLAKEGRPIDADDARDSGVVEETADFLLSIWRPDDAIQIEQQPTAKLKLTVVKSRHGGKGRTFTLQMDLLTLAIVDDATPQAKAAQQHNYMHWRGTTYEDLRREETRPVQLQTA